MSAGRTYEAVRAGAQRLADETGRDRGVERDAFGFHHFVLPRRENRYGHELRCEVVHPSDPAKCQPGHGPKYEPPDVNPCACPAACMHHGTGAWSGPDRG